MKKLEAMNLMDDFLFWTLLSDEQYGPKAAKYMLETILQRPVGKVTVYPQKIIYGEDTDCHRIRMDAYITGENPNQINGEIYDIEPDKKTQNKEDLPFRTR